MANTFHQNLKQSFANFKAKYIGNVPSGVTVAQINNSLTNMYKLVWTNPNDEITFPNQSINIEGHGNFYLLDITIDNAINYAEREHVFIVVGINTRTTLFGLRTADFLSGKRILTITPNGSNDTFTFTHATVQDPNIAQDSWMRPHKIYRIS